MGHDLKNRPIKSYDLQCLIFYRKGEHFVEYYDDVGKWSQQPEMNSMRFIKRIYQNIMYIDMSISSLTVSSNIVDAYYFDLKPKDVQSVEKCNYQTLQATSFNEPNVVEHNVYNVITKPLKCCM